MRPMRLRLPALMLSALLSACTRDPAVTSVRLSLQAEPAWGITTVSVTAGSQEKRVALQRELVVFVNDALAGSAQTIALSGFRGDVKVAAARVVVTPVLHHEVRVTVSLARVACGAWCTPGARDCRGDGIVVCEQRDDDACMEWSAPVTCDRDAPFCSFGRCAATCTDECAMGERRCEGSAIRECGQGDTDRCLEWLSPVACERGQACADGACTAQCRDECTRDAVKCLGAGRATCADRDGDGCTEWGPEVPCAIGESCSMGACSALASCTDECANGACDANTYRQCGQYDLDACRELSVGEACTPRPGSCDAVRCDPARGCLREEHDCVDAGTTRDAGLGLDAGEGLDAGTHVVAMDAGWPGGDAGACAVEGAACTPTAPSSPCFGRTGRCRVGVCVNDFANGASCDDGVACTFGDVCSAGACAGSPIACTSPPPAECIGTVRRTYAPSGTCASGLCSYERTDTPCLERCVAGACVLSSGWVSLSTINAPVRRAEHTAVWTGTEMIVWGGTDGAVRGDGARYNPVTDTWVTMSRAGAPPSARYMHTAVWTGTEMIVWGGSSSSRELGDGARFDPATNMWRSMSSVGAPSARAGHVAVWTGTALIVWGGFNDLSERGDGARYDPLTDSWSALWTSSAPSARSDHTAVWTGDAMVVWGGSAGVTRTLDTGARYLPAFDRWAGVSVEDAPTARYGHTAVWSGAAMLVWGGLGNASDPPTDGGRYDPTTDRWTPMSLPGVISRRYGHSAVWSGSEMIVWGGSAPSRMNDGGRYEPRADTWTTVTTRGAPSPRDGHSAVWTGTEMIVWGGHGTDGYLNDGGRWRP